MMGGVVEIHMLKWRRGWVGTVGLGRSTLRLILERSWGAALDMQGTAVSLLKQLGCRSFGRDDAYNPVSTGLIVNARPLAKQTRTDSLRARLA